MQGAVPVDSSFNVAGDNQADLSLNGQRLFVTPNDERYKQYAELMSAARLPYVHNAKGYGNEDVVVGEIPGDARTLPQIIRPHQSNLGLRSSDVFFMLGRTLHRAVEANRNANLPLNFNVGKILVLRVQQEIMVMPATEQEQGPSIDQLLDDMESQLLPEYTRYGASLLLQKFHEGVEV